MDNSELCNIIKKIQENPFLKMDGLKVQTLYELQEHLKVCQECNSIVDAICEKYKDIPSDPNSEWDKTKYN